MSELLEKARSYEAKKIAATDKESKRFISVHRQDGLMIRMDFLSITEKFICFISTIHICVSGDLCIGGIVRQAI